MEEIEAREVEHTLQTGARDLKIKIDKKRVLLKNTPYSRRRTPSSREERLNLSRDSIRLCKILFLKEKKADSQ